MKIRYIAALTALVAAAAVQAREIPGASLVREMETYLSYKKQIKTPPHFTYLPDNTQYAMLSADGKVVETYDIASGKRTGELVDLSNTRETTLSSMEGFIISPDASKVIVYRNSKPIYRRSFSAEYYVYDLHSRLLRPLSTQFKTQQIPVFSPDSRMVAFVAEGNIYIKKIDFNSEVAVTTDGAAGKIINGATDWVYEEEFSITSTLSWSPDNTMLCYLRFDESKVPVYTLPIYEGACQSRREYALYPGELSYKYPVAGETNSTVTLHSYDVDNRKIKDITLPDKTIEYIPRISFGPTASQLMVSTLNRDQNKFEIFSVNPASGICKSVYSEKSNAWVIPEAYENLTYGQNGFTVLSNRSGHTHAYLYSYTGSLMRTLTSGDFDVTAYYGQDALGNHYVQTATPTPLDRTVQKVDAKKGILAPVSPVGGTTNATYSPDCRYAVMATSSTETPASYTLCTAAGKSLRVLADNKALGESLSAKLPRKEFIKVPSDGRELNGWIMRPRNFDPSRKYPVVMYQYSGPGSQTVLNTWETGWMQYFADHGFIVACVDGRGTGARGSEFMYSVYKNLGYCETIDQINACRYIATLPGVDGSRIGIHGWSYGGYEALMCVTNSENPFAAAVAVAPVTDWRYYDTVYAERYMLTPQQNEHGYNVSAPLTNAGMMSSDLLLMYGTLDDNVHPVNTLQMASAMQTSGVLFDMMSFPNMNHSIYGCNSRAVIYANMFRFFRDRLAPDRK